MSRLIAATMLAAVALGCDSESQEPTASPAASGPEATNGNALAAAEAKPDPAPAPPSPGETARRALEAEDYDMVCTYLEFNAFDRGVCDYLATRARGERAGLPRRAYERFFRAQKVRNRSGTMVDSIGDHEYEVRMGGVAILETIDTEFFTPGRFEMWVQQRPGEEMEMRSGRLQTIPIYQEWKLADDLMNIARHSGEQGQEEAKNLLDYLLGDWSIYAHPDLDPRPDSEWDAFLAAHNAQGAPEQPSVASEQAAQAPQGEARSERTTTRRGRRPTQPQGVSSNDFE